MNMLKQDIMRRALERIAEVTNTAAPFHMPVVRVNSGGLVEDECVVHSVLTDDQAAYLVQSANAYTEVQAIAQAALRDMAATIEYRITARTWYGKNGGEFRAELCEVETGRKLIGVGGSTWGTDAWSYAMRDAMYAQKPDLFPDHGKGHPTIYFRDVCGVEYEHAEVARRRDL